MDCCGTVITAVITAAITAAITAVITTVITAVITAVTEQCTLYVQAKPGIRCGTWRNLAVVSGS